MSTAYEQALEALELVEDLPKARGGVFVLDAEDMKLVRMAAETLRNTSPTSHAVDARRYRWLRSKVDAHDGGLTVATTGAFGLEPWSGDDLDAAIEKAQGAAS
jgi:hypothetical protein